MLSEEQIKLVEDNIELVFFCLKQNHLPISDFEDVGLYGLCKAARSFKSGLGWAFSTYAIKCINNELYYAQRRDYRNKQRYGIVRSLDEVIYKKNGEDEIYLSDTLHAQNNYKIHQFFKDYEEFIKSITDPLYKEIMQMYYLGIPQQDMSRKLGKPQGTISRIIKRHNKKFINTYYEGVTPEDILKEE